MGQLSSWGCYANSVGVIISNVEVLNTRMCLLAPQLTGKQAQRHFFSAVNCNKIHLFCAYCMPIYVCQLCYTQFENTVWY